MDERTLGRTEGFDMLKREILELFDVLQETVNDQ